MTQESEARDDRETVNPRRRVHLLLVEYEEIGRCWRHDDDIAVRLTAILLPLAVGALALALGYPLPPRLVIGLGGMLLMLFWFLYYVRVSARAVLRFGRAKEIERALGLHSHLGFDGPSTPSKTPNIQTLRTVTFIGYCVAWLIVMLLGITSR